MQQSLTTDSASGTLDVEFLGVSANGDTVGNDGDVSYPLQVDTYDGESAVKGTCVPDASSKVLTLYVVVQPRHQRSRMRLRRTS